MDIQMSNQELAEYARKKLKDSPEWETDYARYIFAIQDVRKKLAGRDICHYRVQTPLYEYTTVGDEFEKNGPKVYSQLRYRGQIVGTITADEFQVQLRVDQKTAEDNMKLIVSPEYSLSQEEQRDMVGTPKECDWNSRDAKGFRKFFRVYQPRKPGNPEHELESAFLTELSQVSSPNKSLPGIQPVLFCKSDGKGRGKRFQMPTRFSASKIKAGQLELASGRGGGIDILARRNGILAVIELKDRYESSEGPEQAIQQAIAYGVFLRELIRSDRARGEDWYHLFGFKSRCPQSLTIKCVVAMPDIPDVDCLRGETVTLDGDKLELHCIRIDGSGHVIACSQGF